MVMIRVESGKATLDDATLRAMFADGMRLLRANVGRARTTTSRRDVRYHVTPAPLSDAVSWIADIGRQWDERLARLAALSDPGAGPAPTLH